MWEDFSKSLRELLASEEFQKRRDEKIANGTWLISRDQLLASGALDCPPEWRKSLSARLKPQQRDLFSDLDDDELASPDDEDGQEEEEA